MPGKAGEQRSKPRGLSTRSPRPRVGQPSRLPLSPVSENLLAPATSPSTRPHQLKRAAQDDCFTPKRELPRSPPGRRSQGGGKSRFVQESSSPVSRLSQMNRGGEAARQPGEFGGQQTGGTGVQGPHTPGGKPNRGRDKCRHHGDDTGNQRVVQADCFTPKSTLKRSPVPDRRKTSHSGSTTSEPDLIDVAPPPKRWEIPRTPVASQLSKATRSTRTPEETDKSPPLPTLRSPQSPGERATLGDLPTPPPATPSSTPPHQWSHHPATPPVSSPPLPATHAVRPKPSPPISAAGLPPVSGGLHCTENDLAYLQRLANVKHYDQLQSQVSHLDRAIRTATQQKEQLEQTALKINRDIAEMKAKHRAMALSIKELTSHPTSTSTSSLPGPENTTGAVGSPSATHPGDSSDSSPGSTPQLTSTQVSQLKRAHQLAAAQLERTDRELKKKLTEVNREREEVEAKLREQEAAVKERREQLQSQARAAQAEREEWERKVEEVSQEEAAAQGKLAEVRRDLQKLKAAPNPSGKEGGRGRRLSRAEREKAEERLRRIIVRCDLYVQRHRMLKEMGIRGRRH